MRVGIPLMFIFMMILFSGCRQQQTVPGYEDIPLHPKASQIQSVDDRVEFVVLSLSADEIADYYAHELEKRQWIQVDRWGSAFVYEKRGRKILLVVTDGKNRTKVSVSPFHH
ncbi:hypothetical protein [Geobacillus sp. C56-T2]|uniref:hypothetical protein n=1 Tax=Geobacillus sp. C56-T2 TaxID=600773 RepID=UPI0011A67306|nr:hypothetical protein [Geobacillus sp. C56-T2]NNV06533.1 hypothetical protein [Geobacillus sp. MMMUD3]TWG29389.1 hypothetical protein GC56T2_0431 [Geobacillus sp. C56-T2]